MILKISTIFLVSGKMSLLLFLSDGVNDHGFAVAALYFSGFAQYDGLTKDNTSIIPIAAFELVYFLLSQCASSKSSS